MRLTSLASGDEQIAGPTKFGEMPSAIILVGVWVYFLLKQDVGAVAETLPLLAMGLGLGGWTLLMRLHFDERTIARTIGPWRRAADLTTLESITWKMTGGWRSEGTIFVRDRAGHRVPIYVGRFNRTDEWSRILLDAAARTGAHVDAYTRHLLEQRGKAVAPSH